MKKQLKPFHYPSLTLSQEFHEETKIRKTVHTPPSSTWPDVWKKIIFKAYPRLPIIHFPKPLLNPNFPLQQSLYLRRSVREFSKELITKQDISNLLFFSAGIKGNQYIIGGERFYPSAGARYPLEVYPIVLKAKDLETGIYHYHFKSHLLEKLFINDSVHERVLAHFGSPWMHEAHLLIVMSGAFYRTEVKYGQRGYRHVLTEAGHMCQNMYLLCPVLGLGCCNAGGFVDDALNKLIGIDGIEEAVISVMFVGKI